MGQYLHVMRLKPPNPPWLRSHYSSLDVDTCSPCPRPHGSPSARDALPWFGPTTSFMCSCSSQCHLQAIHGLSSGFLVPQSKAPCSVFTTHSPSTGMPRLTFSIIIGHVKALNTCTFTCQEIVCTHRLMPHIAQHIQQSLITRNMGIY